uniref:uncharacterized protein LOC120332920 n=1 Tax=Styela clava TaxID=7725 RepID=UPI001939F2C2|nr:uncharacterized protein LOC120332920 [Styela clava]
MVSGRLAVAIRQLLLITLLFGCVALMISSQQSAVYDQAAEALKRLRDLQIANRSLHQTAKDLLSNSNQTKELLDKYLKQMNIIEQFTKKRSIILRGLKEENDENLEKAILALILEKFKIDLTSDDLESVERIPGKTPRAIKITFVRFKDKTKIFYKRKNLPKYLSLDDDITTSQKENRKKMDSSAENVFKMGKIVKQSG